MYDVIAIGEYLVDFTPNGTGPMGNPSYEMNPGGAPANCMAACAGAGGKTAVIACVGDDLFGRFLRKKLVESGIGDEYVQVTKKASTTLVFVSLDERGEREFAFVRKPGADTMIEEGKISGGIGKQTRILHFGSLSLTDEPARTATLELAEKAGRDGVMISYDPNYRAGLWGSERDAVYWMKQGLSLADSVKMSGEELELITGYSGKRVREGMEALLESGIKEVYITLGAGGAYYGTAEEIGFVPGFSVKAVDTTGCGDAFTGAALYMACHHPECSMEERVRFANAAGALCATRYGGMTAMPRREEIEWLMERG